MRALAVLVALAPVSALAFCGFFVSGADAELNNNASQVALMRQGQTTVLTMSNNYQGPPRDFAMVVPVPVVLKKAQVKTLKANVFKKIDTLSAPRLVEYWERDPCAPRMQLEGLGMRGGGFGGGGLGGLAKGKKGGFGVKVEAKFSAGEYEVVILSAKEANGLEGWLRHHKYNIPAGASEALAPYIKGGMKFFVAKVNIRKVKRDAHGKVVLSPLRFHFEDKTLRLPVRLGLLNANGKQDLIVYILHKDSRFEVANYKNVFIPSNLEVLDEVRHRFGSFYGKLFDRTLAEAGGRAVVTEYAWQTGSCDPCPTPPLRKRDMFELGGEVIGLGKGKAENESGFGPTFTNNFSRWVLTRLHTRYDKKTLDEDLIFVPAKPVVGGRGSAGLSREKPGAVEAASVNNFQGRYIIRHYWAGKVTCENPAWGQWGGPPEGGKKTQAARDLANVKRDGISLPKLVKSALPQLQIPGMPEKTSR
jgi:hypothetical protein